MALAAFLHIPHFVVDLRVNELPVFDLKLLVCSTVVAPGNQLWTNRFFQIGDESGLVSEDSLFDSFCIVPQLRLLFRHLILKVELCPICSRRHGDDEAASNILNWHPERLMGPLSRRWRSRRRPFRKRRPIQKCPEFLSQLVYVVCISRVFMKAELLQELTKAHIARIVCVCHEGVELTQQHCRL